MIKQIALFFLALSWFTVAHATPIGDCEGSPSEAVVELPAPLSEWGSIVCTAYGHIISNREGWVWSQPGDYSPVFVPSQMVRSHPQPLGNDSYFTRIAFDEMALTDTATSDALAALLDGFPQESVSKAWKLRATGSLGRRLTLYFFNFDTSIWGIWCDADGFNCNSDSMFMVLDMRNSSE